MHRARMILLKLSRSFFAAILLASLLFVTSWVSAQDLHTTASCPPGQVPGNVDWASPAGAGQFDWTDGALTYTATNVSGTQVDVTFTWTGETSTFGNISGVTTPNVEGTISGGEDIVTLITNGFSGSGMTLTMTLSPAIPGTIGYEIHHMNTTGAAGDRYDIHAVTTEGTIVYPTFTANGSPSWADLGNGVVNATGSSTAGQNDQVGVNFNTNEYISTIIMQWRDCNTCSTGQFHGAGFGDFDFCIDDWDLDGIHNLTDIDDDNDGIPDRDEQCSGANPSGTVDWDTENWSSGSATGSFTNSSVTVNANFSSTGNALSAIDDLTTHTGGLSPAQSSLYVEVNQSNTSQQVVGSFDFSIPVDSLSFSVFDVDLNGSNFIDSVRIVGYSFGEQFYPTLTAGSSNSVNENSATGTAASGSSSSNGNVVVQFTSPIDSMVIYLGSGASANSDPDAQAISIHDLSWTSSCPDYDTDGDGTPNHLDIDSENDGVMDLYESGISLATLATLDTDGDGVIDAAVGTNGLADGLETVADNGIINFTYIDTDGDGQLNRFDLDSDSDGITDLEEGGSGGTDANNDGVIDGTADSDNDGLLDSGDNDDSSIGSTSGEPLNTDGGSLWNFIDIDSDDDGIVDLIEAQLSNSITYPSGTDSDGDGLDNNFETGGLTPVDTDGDGIPDYIDTDSDNDGDLDALEGYDTDNDGVANTTPSGSDTDGDGLDNNYDNVNGINTTTNVSNNNQDALDFPNLDVTATTERDWREILDSDNDGITDINDNDCDNDGIPNSAEGATDDDGDGIANQCDIDSDGDGIPDIIEAGGTDANNDGQVDYPTPGDPSTMTDVDGDGISDDYDTDLGFSPISVNGDCSGTTTNYVHNVSFTSSQDVTSDIFLELFVRGDYGGGGGINENITVTGEGGANLGTYDRSDSDNPQYGDCGTTPMQFAITITQAQWNSWNDNGSVDVSVTAGTGVNFCTNYSCLDSARVSIKTTVTQSGDCSGTTTGYAHNVALASGTDDVPDDVIIQWWLRGDFGDESANNEDITLTGEGGTNLGTFDRDDSDNNGYGDCGGTAMVFFKTISAANWNSWNNDGTVNLTFTSGTGVNFCTNYSCLDSVKAIYTTSGGTPGTDISGTDSDGDGTVDYQDLDSDNDGILDLYESGISISTLTTIDPDGDGVIESTAGNNGLADAIETSADNGTINYTLADSDGDNVVDRLDLDSDNDGITDLAENGNGTDANNDGIVDGASDADGDGILDSADGDDASFGSPSTTALNTDGDNVYNFRDLDSDNDGITDLVESGTGTDANNDGIVDGSTDVDGDGVLSSADSDDSTIGSVHTPTNSDADAAPNYLDLDSDNDGVSDLAESGTGTDANNDGVVDGTTDADGDGVIASADSDDSTDGSIHTPTDTDGNGPANYLDLDSDNDGITDLAESGTGTDANNDGIVDGSADADGDGFLTSADTDDASFGSVFTPTNTDGRGPINSQDLDSDDDGITDLVESGTGTDANNDGIVDGTTDVDGDGVIASADSDDSTDGSVHTPTNTDGNGPADYLDLDSDNDGITDLAESGTGTDANNDGIVDGTTDVDGDGVIASADSDDSTDGSVHTPTNSDADAAPNYLDLDSDNDGVLDLAESGTGTDADNNGVVDGATDNDGDGVIASADSDDSTDGHIHTATDTDGNGPANYLDLDSDNDGITDRVESGQGTDAGNNGIVDGSTDTDGDGILDSEDNNDGVFGSPSQVALDTDQDGVINAQDIDSDNDGITDHEESGTGTDANNDGVVDGTSDADGDGVITSADSDDSTNGSVHTPTNTDSDSFANYIDIDADDDGIIDNIEAQASTLTPIVPGGSDTDGDGLDNAFESTNGLTPVNTESTGDPDYLDSDTDDDGESDLIEGNDINDDGVADTAPSNSDTDGDGLDNSYDNVNGWNSTTNVTNGGQDAFDFPDNDEGDTELDWREVPCANGLVILAPSGTTTSAPAKCKQSPWTYYYNALNPTQLLFAIEKFPSGGGANTSDFTATVTLTVNNTPTLATGIYNAADIPGQQATFVMGRYWNVNITSGAMNGTVNVRFFYDPAELTIMETTAQAWNTANGGGSLVESGTMWFKTLTTGVNFSHSTQLTTGGISDALQLTPASTGTVDGTTYVQFDGVTSFSGGGAAYTVGVNSVILPVELLNFDAIKQGEDVLLNWATATEVNNDYFTIERSNDLKNWEIVGHMDGAGSSSRRIDYSMMDYNPLPGRSYYRLKQTDFNGDYDYSEVREIVFEGAAPEVTLIPNPTLGDVTIRVSSANADKVKVQILDATGKIIHQMEDYSQNGKHELFVGDLASGSYYVKVIGDKYAEVEKLIVH